MASIPLGLSHFCVAIDRKSICSLREPRIYLNAAHSPPEHPSRFEPLMTQEDSPVEAADLKNVPPPAPVGFEEEASGSEEVGTRRSRKKSRMYCFHCNRQEVHANPYIGAWFYSYFIGLTFGLLHFIGPFRCTCCGRQRLMFRDWAHPKFHAIMARNRAAATSRRR